jgi:calcineurin-like phosphoesterase family protein
MKLTNETLRELYLKDLATPDIFHGRSTSKVRYIQPWKDIPAHSGDSIIHELNVDEINYDVWFWSDQHFGHRNIIKYADRPFVDTDTMHEALIQNYLNVVKPNDVVFWCGDIAFMQDPAINSIIGQLPGYKVHIVGNHDFDRSNKLKNIVMDERHLCYALDINTGIDNFQLLLTHYPITRIPVNCVNVHGHLHQNVADSWNINVSVECTNYSPINLRDIVMRATEYLKLAAPTDNI